MMSDIENGEREKAYAELKKRLPSLTAEMTKNLLAGMEVMEDANLEFGDALPCSTISLRFGDERFNLVVGFQQPPEKEED